MPDNSYLPNFIESFDKTPFAYYSKDNINPNIQ